MRPTDLLTMAVQSVKRCAELDYMEYSSDALAQAAYVSSSSYDAYTKTASHFDGADEATAYTDPIAGAYTFVANAQLDTAQKKFGTASLLLDGTGDYVTLPDSDSWNFGAGNFTIDFWVRFNNLPTSGSFQTFYMQSQENTSATNTIYMILRNTSGTYTLEFIWYTTSSQIGCIKTVTVSTDNWYHFALVRYGNDFKFYLSGVQQGTATTADVTLPDYSKTIGIGVYNHTETPRFFVDGHIDEFRISKGVARWTANFTPPISPYPNDLQSYSESTIKTQGTYSLKGVAAITDSLDDTLTKTVSTIDMSGVNKVKFDIRSSRTGNTLQLHIHDSGGTTTSTTAITIASANVFQAKEIDLSGVADANKDAIDEIVVTVTNADAENTFYIDNLRYR